MDDSLDYDNYPKTQRSATQLDFDYRGPAAQGRRTFKSKPEKQKIRRRLGGGEDKMHHDERGAIGPPNKRLELSSAKHRKRARRARKVTCHSPKTGFKTADVIGPKKAPGRPGYMLHHRKPAPGPSGANSYGKEQFRRPESSGPVVKRPKCYMPSRPEIGAIGARLHANNRI